MPASSATMVFCRIVAAAGTSVVATIVTSTKMKVVIVTVIILDATVASI